MDWRAVVAEQKSSGLSISEFCREREIRPNNFYNWRSKLSEPNGAMAVARKEQFAKVETQSRVSLELENGVKLKVAVQDLRAVLMALR